MYKVTWWAHFKIYKTEQDEIKAVFEDCREMGFEFRRPKDFLLPALLVIIDHNHDGDITNDELRSVNWTVYTVLDRLLRLYYVISM